MKIKTRKFGETEIDENTIFTMPEGLPGFSGHHRFVILEDSKTAPFCWLQSLDNPDIALVVMNPFLFKPDYQFDLKGLVLSRNWGDVGSENVHVYVVINISGSDAEQTITANLMGPIVINSEKKEAFQMVISDPSYSHQHKIL